MSGLPGPENRGWIICYKEGLPVTDGGVVFRSGVWEKVSWIFVLEHVRSEVFSDQNGDMYRVTIESRPLLDPNSPGSTPPLPGPEKLSVVYSPNTAHIRWEAGADYPDQGSLTILSADATVLLADPAGLSPVSYTVRLKLPKSWENSDDQESKPGAGNGRYSDTEVYMLEGMSGPGEPYVEITCNGMWKGPEEISMYSFKVHFFDGRTTIYFTIQQTGDGFPDIFIMQPGLDFSVSTRDNYVLDNAPPVQTVEIHLNGQTTIFSPQLVPIAPHLGGRLNTMTAGVMGVLCRDYGIMPCGLLPPIGTGNQPPHPRVPVCWN